MTVLSTRTAADVHRERQRRKAEADALSADGAAASSATSDRRSSIVPKSHERRPIRLLHAFGSQSADIGSAVLLDDNNVLHRCGRWLVSQEIDATAVPTKLSPMDFFLELSPQVSRITVMSMAGNHKYVAVGEVCDEPPGAAPQALADAEALLLAWAAGAGAGAAAAGAPPPPPPLLPPAWQPCSAQAAPLAWARAALADASAPPACSTDGVLLRTEVVVSVVELVAVWW
jgi:hypothetical protein